MMECRQRLSDGFVFLVADVDSKFGHMRRHIHEVATLTLGLLFLAAASNSAHAQSLTVNGTAGTIAIYEGNTVTVHAVRGGTANRFDTIKLYAVGGSSVLAVYYMNGTGTAPATAIADATFDVRIVRPAGDYEFRYLAGVGNSPGSQVLATSGQIEVSAPLLAVDNVTPPNELSVPPASTVTLSINGGTGGRWDWIGMFRKNDLVATKAGALTWFYLSGSTSAPSEPLYSATISVTMPIARGDFEFRYYQNSGAFVNASSLVVGTSPMTPRERFGVVAFSWRNEILDLGAGTVRGSCSWGAMQATDSDPSVPGNVNWQCTDNVIKTAATYGVRVLMTISCTPTWAATAVNNDNCEVKIPDLTKWTNFVAAFVGRYSSYDVVLGVYNEPNLARQSYPAITYAGYCSMFEAAASARGSSDMALAGPETSWHGSKATDLYFANALNCILPHMEPQDVVTLHYYADAASEFSLTSQMEDAADLAEGHEVWLTELGIKMPDFTQSSLDAQALYLRSAIDAFDNAALTNASWTTSVYYRLWANDSHNNYALLNSGNYSPRPAFNSYKGLITELTGEGVGAMTPNETLPATQSVFSSGNEFQLEYQSNGNLALIDTSTSTTVWETLTSGYTPGEAVWDNDGVLSLYDPSSVLIFAVGAIGNPNSYLVVRYNGKMSIYNSSGRPIANLFTPYP